MNRQIIVTGVKFEGEILIEYDSDTEQLLLLDMTKTRLTQQQLQWWNANIPTSILALQQLQIEFEGKKKTMFFTDKVIDFAMFWDKYDEKVRSSKKKAKARWDKMSKSEQLKAFNFIPKYFVSMHSSTAKKYAETYLNSEIWNNESLI